MFIYVFLGLLGLGIYYALGAVWALVCLVPFLLLIPYYAVRDAWRWWRGRKQRRLSAARFRRWQAWIDEGIREHEERFPESGDVDENGIPYL